MEVNKEINDIAYAMFKTDYKYVALDGCKVAVLETYISKSISEAAQNASLKEELQRVYELVKKWHNQSDANEQCWKETVKDYNDLRERYKQLHEENADLAHSIRAKNQLLDEYEQRIDELVDLKEENERLKAALDEILYPVKYMQIRAKEAGADLNGVMAITLAESPSYLRDIARHAISPSNLNE
jgi:DNA repair exonuclease SbcCD ATPase subunit